MRHSDAGAGSEQRVVMVSHAGDFGGGGEIGFRDLMMAIQQKRPDIEITAVYPWAGTLAQDAQKRGIRTKVGLVPWWSYVDGNRSPIKAAILRQVKLVAAVGQAVVLLRRVRPGVVITNTMSIPAHAIAAKLLGIRHYWVVREFGRDDHGFRFMLDYPKIIRIIGQLSEVVVCNSRAVEAAVHAIDPDIHTAVLYPAIDAPADPDPAVQPARRRPGEPLRAVLVGNLAGSKGQHLAIAAIAAARKAGVDVELVLVGGGDWAPLRKLARELAVEDLVSMHGPSMDLSAFWSAAHVGLMCSRCEAFGRVTVEAMSAGLPVCGTDSGGTIEIIEPGANGLLSPPGDAQALADNLVALATDEELRLRLAKGALETAPRFGRERFDHEVADILGLG